MDSVWVGFDQREAAAFAVCRSSIERNLTQAIPVRGIILSRLQANGFYTRPTERRDGQLWDVISEAPMSTAFAITRFFVPHLAGKEGWAVFMDCDFLVRESLCRLFEGLKSRYAVMVVKHQHEPDHAVKMDGQAQTKYARKNWSSLTAWNLSHPAHEKLTLEVLNTWPGRDLHAFKWLKDDEIGELGVEWNYLCGVSKANVEPKCVHFTLGTPDMRGYEHCDYADEFRAELERWAA